METWTERMATLPLPTVVLLLAGLTLGRVILRALRLRFFLFLSELLESAMLAIAMVFLLLRPFVVQTYHIPSGSMHPTLIEGDHILVDKLLYRIRAPRQGEIVVFRAPHDADRNEAEFIKRLVGLPGDTIEVHPGYVQVGGIHYTHNEVRGILGTDESEEATKAALHLTPDAIFLGEQRILPAKFAAQAGHAEEPVEIHPGRVVRNGKTLLEDYVAEDPEYELLPYAVPPDSYFVLGDNRNQSHDSHEWGVFSTDRLIGRAEAIFWPLPRLRKIR